MIGLGLMLSQSYKCRHEYFLRIVVCLFGGFNFASRGSFCHGLIVCSLFFPIIALGAVVIFASILGTFRRLIHKIAIPAERVIRFNPHAPISARHNKLPKASISLLACLVIAMFCLLFNIGHVLLRI